MKVEIIPNKGPASMHPEISQMLRWATEVNIASAFVTPKALVLIEKALEEVRKNKRTLKIKLLFGLYQRFTPPQTLKKLLELQKQYPSNLFVRVSKNNRFHWKLYIFKNGNTRYCYVGSSNFTEDGLTKSGELSIKLSAKNSDDIARALEIEFNVQWNPVKSFSLDKDLYKKYSKIKRPTTMLLSNDNEISVLLESATKAVSITPTNANNKIRILFIDSFISPEAEEIIKENTEWDDKNWDYAGHDSQKWFNTIVNSKFVLQVGQENDNKFWVGFWKIEESVILETPKDGKYFVAYSKVPRSWYVPYNKIKNDLNDIGLNWNKIKKSPQLTKGQLQKIYKLLHINAETL